MHGNAEYLFVCLPPSQRRYALNFCKSPKLMCRLRETERPKVHITQTDLWSKDTCICNINVPFCSTKKLHPFFLQRGFLSCTFGANLKLLTTNAVHLSSLQPRTLFLVWMYSSERRDAYHIPVCSIFRTVQLLRE
jgi:hypothetical protein